MANPQTTRTSLADVLQKLDVRDTDDAAEALDEALSRLTETTEHLHKQMVQLMSDRNQLVAERDLALHKEATLRQALKVLIADWDAMNDMPGGGMDAAEFDQHLQAVRELVEKA